MQFTIKEVQGRDNANRSNVKCKYMNEVRTLSQYAILQWLMQADLLLVLTDRP